MSDNLRVIPLGGTEEVGINSTIFENKGDIIVVDFGLGFSEDDVYGIDFIIPNFEYLKQNKAKIRGIVITHGHLDHIGGLPYVLDQIGNPPVYGTKMTASIIRDKLKDTKKLKDASVIEFSPDDTFKLGSFNLSFFRVNHNIPDSVGIVIGTQYGNIVHTGDFKFDNTPFEEPVTEYGKIAKVGMEGVLLLLSDSTNATKTGMSVSESSITPVLEGIIVNAMGRVIAATFSSLLTRVNQLISLAYKHGRKVAISGSSMVSTVSIAKSLGYLKVPKDLFIKIEDVPNYPENEVLIITTGAQGEENAGLMKMIMGEHTSINIKKEDTILLSSSVIPTNAFLVQKLLDFLVGSGAHVIHQSIMDVHAGGHAHQEDHKLLFNLVKPKYFMPIEGYQSFLDTHIQTAKSVGIKEENILFPRNGLAFEYDESRGFIKKERIKHAPVRISGNTIGDLGNRVMKEREQLSGQGLVTVLFNVNSDHKLILPVHVISRGFVFSKKSFQLIDIVEKKAQSLFESHFEGKEFETGDVREYISKRLQSFLFEKYGKDPLILVIVNINGNTKYTSNSSQ